MFTIKAYHFNPINVVCITLLAIILCLLLAGKPATSTPIHRCIDPTHQECDGNCECDGMGCATAVNAYHPVKMPANPYYKMRDYQIQISDDQNTLIIFDGDRVVGTYPLRWNTMLGKMILIDND